VSASASLTLGGAGDPVLPLAALEEPVERAGRWRVEGRPILATEWEVPPHLAAEKLAAWVRALSPSGE